MIFSFSFRRGRPMTDNDTHFTFLISFSIISFSLFFCHLEKNLKFNIRYMEEKNQKAKFPMTRLKLRLVIDDRAFCHALFGEIFLFGGVCACVPFFCHLLQSEKMVIFQHRKKQTNTIQHTFGSPICFSFTTHTGKQGGQAMRPTGRFSSKSNLFQRQKFFSLTLM